jgi:putative ABC transport system permease protein
MLKNYFRTALRSLSRNKLHSFINIAGLTLGFAACFLIGLFVWDENQFDKFVPDGGQVYRICNSYTNSEGNSNYAVGPPMFAVVLQKDFPEVEQSARVLETGEFKSLFEAGKYKIYEDEGLFVDPGFPAVFSMQYKYGSPVKSLDDPGSVIISTEMAKQFFGDENPVGKQILKDKVPFQIKGVFEKNPRFHLPFNFLIPITAAQIPAERMQSWEWQQFLTYAKLKKGTDFQVLERKYQNSISQKSDPFTLKHNARNKPFFQPLDKIHLYSASLKFDIGPRGNIIYVRALSIIALFILLIACFNFVNLATAKSLQRAKEVGIRKTIGANREQLVLQFVGETVLLSMLSTIGAVAVSILLVPWLNSFTGKEIPADWFTNPELVAILFLLALVVGIAAGFYPALVLSGFKPSRVLKGQVTGDEDSNKIPWLRHGLVIIQFALSVLLIISAIVVFKQVDYLHNKDLGFNKEEIMFFPMRGDNLSKNYEAFKNELLKSPGIASVSIGYGFPGDAVAGDEVIVPINGQQKKLPATQLMVDYDYIKTLGLQMVTGRDFSKAMQTDKDHAFIINETAVRQLGFGTPEKALGKQLAWNVWGASNPDSVKTGQVIGVVRDFHYKSLFDKIEPAVLQIYPDAYWKVAIKMKTAEKGQTLGFVKKVWDSFTPDYPIEYKFLDDNFRPMYLAEDKLEALLGIFTGISVFIGCLGLFGLIAYSAERRKKEIGIRKVLGASVQNIVFLLSTDFIKLVVIALLIASPVAAYFMHQWLQDFAYRIDIEWWIFAFAAISALGVAFLTVSFQALKAAIANPVKSLKSE